MGCLIKKYDKIKKNMTKIKNGQHSYLSTLAKGGVQVFHTKDEKQKKPLECFGLCTYFQLYVELSLL